MGPTLTIAKSKIYDRVFGGYTNIPWSNRGGEAKDQGLSFIFSVQDDGSLVKMKHVGAHLQYEVDHESYSLFETAGYALGLRDKCNKNMDSYSILTGKKFELPPGILEDSVEAETFIAGAKNFAVEEIEVFLIT